MDGIDRSPLSWEGRNQIENRLENYNGESSNNDSLFYLFNTIPSPAVGPPSVSCPISNEAIQSIFGCDELHGLRTKLYPYQRRTIASMIKREVQPKRALDPRFQSLEGPTGQPFYYDRETGVLLRDQRTYEEARGGILGESMGLGKTLICLATISATKGHWYVHFSANPSYTIKHLGHCHSPEVNSFFYVPDLSRNSDLNRCSDGALVSVLFNQFLFLDQLAKPSSTDINICVGQRYPLNTHLDCSPCGRRLDHLCRWRLPLLAVLRYLGGLFSMSYPAKAKITKTVLLLWKIMFAHMKSPRQSLGAVTVHHRSRKARQYG